MRRPVVVGSLVVVLAGVHAFAMDGLTIRYEEVKGKEMPGFVVRNNTGSQVIVKAWVAAPTNPQSKWSPEEYKAGGTVKAGESGFISLLDFKDKKGKSMDPAQVIWKKNQRPSEGCMFTFDVSAGGKKDTIYLSLKSLYP